MAAMRIEATLVYEPKLVALSTIVALSGSLIALQLAFSLPAKTTVLGSVDHVGRAILMGSAIAGVLQVEAALQMELQRG